MDSEPGGLIGEIGKALVVLVVCLAIAGIVSAAVVLRRFAGSCGADKPVSEQWSGDRAF